LQLNPQFDVEQFLATSWQREPRLLPKFIEDFVDPVSADDLAGLACEIEVESRLVHGTEPSELRLEHGPFPEQQLQTLNERGWTLLVQAVDQWDEGVADLLHYFEFLPAWLIDDVMVSFATPGGGVGPHYDNYDVFLLQGSGNRKWQVGARYLDTSTGSAVGDPGELVDQDGLKLLADFTTLQTFELSAGDALYIPARFAHWGIAHSNSLCYSIGLRHPSAAEMLEGFSQAIIDKTGPEIRFHEVSQKITNPAEIRPGDVAAGYQQIARLLDSPTTFQNYFGCAVTEPKYPELISRPQPPVTPDDIPASTSWEINPASRVAFLRTATGVQLFADASLFELPETFVAIVESLCAQRIIPVSEHERILQTEAGPQLLVELINQGTLIAP